MAGHQIWVLMWVLISINISQICGTTPEEIEAEFLTEFPETVKSKFKTLSVSQLKLEELCQEVFGENPVTAREPFTVQEEKVKFNHSDADIRKVEVIQCAHEDEYIREGTKPNSLFLLRKGKNGFLNFVGDKHYNGIDENEQNANMMPMEYQIQKNSLVEIEPVTGTDNKANKVHEILVEKMEPIDLSNVPIKLSEEMEAFKKGNTHEDKLEKTNVNNESQITEKLPEENGIKDNKSQITENLTGETDIENESLIPKNISEVTVAINEIHISKNLMQETEVNNESHITQELPKECVAVDESQTQKLPGGTNVENESHITQELPKEIAAVGESQTQKLSGGTEAADEFETTEELPELVLKTRKSEKLPEEIEAEFTSVYPEKKVKSQFKTRDISKHKLESHCIEAFGEKLITASQPFTIQEEKVKFNPKVAGIKTIEVVQCAKADEYIRESVVYHCLYLLRNDKDGFLRFEDEKCYPKYNRDIAIERKGETEYKFGPLHSSRQKHW